VTGNGRAVSVDDADFDELSRWKWTAYRARHTWYVMRNVRGVAVSMHRLLTGAVDGQMVDHIDGDGLNNQRANLRLVTNAENQQNRKALTTNTSGARGVSWDKRCRRWRAAIKHQRKTLFLGRFDTKEQASAAYETKARELFTAREPRGEHAKEGG
jgi:hypothetical protein